MNYTTIREQYEKKGYKFYTKPYDLNIGGYRSIESESNSFDDLIFVAFTNGDGEGCLVTFPATTDPGKYWLQNPMNKNGTLIVCPGQFPGCYKIGLHGKSGPNPYRALEQIGKMLYVRDNDKNSKLDFSLYRDPIKKAAFSFVDNCKSNLHRASKWQAVRFVERYSAGCQVIQKPGDFETLLALCDKQVKAGFGDIFTYTLFDEFDD